MTRWEELEEWLFEHDLERFSVGQLAKSMGRSTTTSSLLIQSYLQAQRRPDSATLFVLKREGRTSASVWSVGQRTADARVIGGTLFSDVSVKVKRAFEPDLRRLSERNPKAAKYAEQKIEAVMDGALKVLAAAVDQMFNDEE